MAISTYNAKLMYKESNSSEWAPLVPIKGIPQIGGEPEQLETTTNDDKIQTFIDGIQQQETMSVTINTEKATRTKLKGIKGKTVDLSFWLGMDGEGSEGKFTGKGRVSYYINSSDVNAVIETTIVITPTTPFEEE